MLGQEAVIVLLNPTAALPAGYEWAYALEENPHPDWRGGLLSYERGGQWELGVAMANGQPVVHGRSPARPTLEEIDGVPTLLLPGDPRYPASMPCAGPHRIRNVDGVWERTP